MEQPQRHAHLGVDGLPVDLLQLASNPQLGGLGEPGEDSKDPFGGDIERPETHRKIVIGGLRASRGYRHVGETMRVCRCAAPSLLLTRNRPGRQAS